MRNFRLKRRLAVIAVLMRTGHGAVFGTAQSQPRFLSDEVRELLRNRVEAAGFPARLNVGGERIHSAVMIPRFYERRAYVPGWSDDRGPLPVTKDLIEVVSEADREGFRPEDYHLETMQMILGEINENPRKKNALNPRRLVDPARWRSQKAPVRPQVMDCWPKSFSISVDILNQN